MKGYLGSRYLFWLVGFFAFFVIFAGCQSYQQQKDSLSDTPTRGRILISADESFKPIIDAQIQVYESNYPGTTIAVQYKPEAECLKDLLTDSVRVVIATRRASVQEERLI